MYHRVGFMLGAQIAEGKFERALAFTELPEKLNQMWQKLGYTGLYPEPEWQFGTYQIEENEEKEQDGLKFTPMKLILKDEVKGQ